MDSTVSKVLLPADKGTYILILRMDAGAHLTIGRLGAFDCPAGWYAYTGSAMGPGGLRGRLKHHLKPINKPHWHIDYLRAAVDVRAVWYHAGETVHEHTWADALRTLPGATNPIRRFGASDCACTSHLIHFPAEPDFEAFRAVAGVAINRWRAVT
jgi:Uri superfamily endonuclease